MLLSKIRFTLNSNNPNNNNTNEAGARLWQNKLSLNNSQNNGFDNYYACDNNFGCHEGYLNIISSNDVKKLVTRINGQSAEFININQII